MAEQDQSRMIATDSPIEAPKVIAEMTIAAMAAAVAVAADAAVAGAVADKAAHPRKPVKAAPRERGTVDRVDRVVMAVAADEVKRVTAAVIDGMAAIPVVIPAMVARAIPSPPRSVPVNQLHPPRSLSLRLLAPGRCMVRAGGS